VDQIIRHIVTKAKYC